MRLRIAANIGLAPVIPGTSTLWPTLNFLFQVEYSPEIRCTSGTSRSIAAMSSSLTMTRRLRGSPCHGMEMGAWSRERSMVGA